MSPPSVREVHWPVVEVSLRDEDALTWGCLQANGNGRSDRSLRIDGSSLSALDLGNGKVVCPLGAAEASENDTKGENHNTVLTQKTSRYPLFAPKPVLYI